MALREEEEEMLRQQRKERKQEKKVSPVRGRLAPRPPVVPFSAWRLNPPPTPNPESAEAEGRAAGRHRSGDGGDDGLRRLWLVEEALMTWCTRHSRPGRQDCEVIVAVVREGWNAACSPLLAVS